MKGSLGISQSNLTIIRESKVDIHKWGCGLEGQVCRYMLAIEIEGNRIVRGREWRVGEEFRLQFHRSITIECFTVLLILYKQVPVQWWLIRLLLRNLECYTGKLTIFPPEWSSVQSCDWSSSSAFSRRTIVGVGLRSQEKSVLNWYILLER